ncbi:MAG: YqeG family HAD IIIA-type phosphatase [Epulopiscium sp.]|nr:YqeG family HAD IIIA-type phosphatase [Candidatus Epulonipiscium sp.]
MLRQLFPKDYIRSIFDLNIMELKKNKIRGLIFDIDNTLVPFDVAHPNQKLIRFFEELKEDGFKICLVSNNTKERVIKFNEELKLCAIHKASKPRSKSFKKAMELMKTNKDNTVVIGDQVFTDVWGGNRAGLMTILVAPVSERDEWITKLKRGLERSIIRIYEGQRGK